VNSSGVGGGGSTGSAAPNTSSQLNALGGGGSTGQANSSIISGGKSNLRSFGGVPGT